MELIRLDKLLCDTGAYTRAQARSLIASGAVTADGAVVRSPEQKLPRSVCIRVAGEEIDTARFVYYMLHKPAGYVCSTRDEGGYSAVTGLLTEPMRKRGVSYVGRLDADVTGLLLLTDDGAYAHRVMSPRSEIQKCYEALLDAPLTERDRDGLRQGVVLPDETAYRPAEAVATEDPCRWLISVTEGRYHEVKRLIASCGRRLLSLQRVAVGALALPSDLAPGCLRRLHEEEAMSVFHKID